LIIGYGHIGRAVEQRLAGFEVDAITRVAQNSRSEPLVHSVAELPELLPQADVVFITAPATPQTHHLLDAEALALLPDGALVINVGRGGIIKTDALVAQLGRIEAALDVTDPEPLPADHPLWDSPHVLWTPHVGGWSGAARRRYDALLSRQLRRLAQGLKPLNIVRSPSP